MTQIISSKMPFSWTPLNSHPLLNPQPPHIFPFLNLKPLKFSPSCSSNNTSSTQTNPNNLKLNDVPKKKRKPRPSFYEQIREKWSAKPITHTHKLPWQLNKEQEQEKCENLEEKPSKMVGFVEKDENISGFVESSNLDAQVIGFGGNLDQKLSNSTLDDDVVRYNLDNKLNFSLNDEKSKFVETKLSDVDDSCSENDNSDVITQLKDGNLVNDLVVEKLVEPKSNLKEETVELYGSRSSKKDVHSKSYLNGKDDSGSLANDLVVENLVVENLFEFKSNVKEDKVELYGSGSKKDEHSMSYLKDDSRSLMNDLVVEKLVESKSNVEEDVVELCGSGSKKDVHSKNYLNSKDDSGSLVNDLVVEKLVESKSNVKDDKVESYGSGSKKDVHSKSYLNGKDDSGSCVEESSANRVPWVRESGWDGGRRMRIKTELAERIIPEHDLKRLRYVSLRMKERMKVGKAGVTQAVVDAVHEKWKIDEVVKFKFEGPLTLNMKRVHDVLESKTGGVVIWRSGSSVALFRGLTYKLDCVNTYVKEKAVHLDVLPQSRNSVTDSLGLLKNVSEEELMEASEFDNLLDGLGPQYADWTGRPPLPVDADLLPGVVPGYKTPFRLLPHGVRRSLKDGEITNFRRQARIMPPHFALGRNRELQGLAAAIVKLWEKTAVAKIAIKRGVLNTNNERMTEELRRLTGGVLLSRNKDFIVFYRGNDFLPPPVTKSLKERERLSMLQYQEEEARRSSLPLIDSNSRKSKIPVVAGTLAETAAATARWAKQPNSEEVEKMLKDAAMTRRTALVNHLQKKLATAKGKLKKAEKALEKVHEYLEPEELPTDLETITDEERLVFRKMGLSMKPYLLLGRREVFDGTIENMHLHWKFREVVKIIVKGKNFGQLKHIAISLEAESGGVLVSIDKTTKGYAIIFYRGKNYRQPVYLKPRNLLTRRQALARSIELQRREALKHHISNLQEQMELVKSELENLEDGKELSDKSFYKELDNSSIPSNDDMEEDAGEEAYLQTYDSGDE